MGKLKANAPVERKQNDELISKTGLKIGLDQGAEVVVPSRLQRSKACIKRFPSVVRKNFILCLKGLASATKDCVLTPWRVFVYTLKFRWKWILYGRSFDRWFLLKLLLLFAALYLQEQAFSLKQPIDHRPLQTVAVINRSPGNLTVWLEHEVYQKIFFHRKLFKESFKNVWQNGIIQNDTNVYMTLGPNDTRTLTVYQKDFLLMNSTFSSWPARFYPAIPTEIDNVFTIMIIDDKGELHIHDDMSIKQELTRANHACHDVRKEDPVLNHETWSGCLGANAFGGIPSTISSSFWYSRQSYYEAWVQCELQPVSEPKKTEVFKTVFGDKNVDIYTEKPFIAVIRNMLSENDCKELDTLWANVSVRRPRHWPKDAKTKRNFPKYSYPELGTVDATTKVELAALSFANSRNLNLSRTGQEHFEQMNFSLWQDIINPHGMLQPHQVRRRRQRKLWWFAYCGVANLGGEMILQNLAYKVKPQFGDLIVYQMAQPNKSSWGICPVRDGEHKMYSQGLYGTLSKEEWRKTILPDMPYARARSQYNRASGQFYSALSYYSKPAARLVSSLDRSLGHAFFGHERLDKKSSNEPALEANPADLDAAAVEPLIEYPEFALDEEL